MFSLKTCFLSNTSGGTANLVGNTSFVNKCNSYMLKKSFYLSYVFIDITFCKSPKYIFSFDIYLMHICVAE